MKRHCRDSSMTLVETVDLDNGQLDGFEEGSVRAFYQVYWWARGFLCWPHPMLGRPGLVCPWARASIEKGLFWMAEIPVELVVPGAVDETVLRYRDWLLDLEPRDNDGLLKTILLLFPGLGESDIPAVVDARQQRLKAEFIEKGLMIGQFHEKCNETGVRNSSFRPLRSPVPMLVVRRLVEQDKVFMTKPEYMEAYKKFFEQGQPDASQG